MKVSVASVFNKPQTTGHADSTWIPKIILNIPTPPCVSSLLPRSTTSINTTNIVPFLQAPSVQLGNILRYQLNYPNHCNLCLKGYHNMVDSDKLTNNIVTSATNNGISLKIETNDQYTTRPNT